MFRRHPAGGSSADALSPSTLFEENRMLGLTTLGIVHTAISLVAVVCGFWAVARYKEISLQTALGRSYVVTTLLTALTGLGIFAHGGFGPPHGLAVLTLLALGLGTAAAYTGVLGRRSRYLQAVCFSTTLLFHMIPGFTETLTRLPAGQPLLPNAEAPEFKTIYGVLFAVYALALVLQLRWLRGQIAAEPLAVAPAV
jgi:uncharacterized membrane protein